MIKLQRKHKFTTKVYNEGKYQPIIEATKKQLLCDIINDYPEIAKEEKEYPTEDGLQEITLSVDVVIMDRHEYEQLLKQVK